MRKLYMLIISGLFLYCNSAIGQNINTDSVGASSKDTISKNMNAAGGKSCIDCHGELVEKKYKHSTETGKDCEDCHKSTGITHPTGKIELQSALPGLCLSCHEETKTLLAESPTVHGPTRDKKSCMNCHSPHSSDVKKLLVTNRKDLCMSCHDKTIKDKSRTIPGMASLMNSKKVLHPPFENCAKACHNPHASQDSRLLDIAYPVNKYVAVNSDSLALCWECHGSDMIEKPKTTSTTNFRNADDNLHFIHVNGEKGRSCSLCHSPHATSNPHLVKESVNFGKWEFRMNYIKTETGGSCAPGCHTEKKYSR